VYVDSATLRPATIPPEMAAAFGVSPDSEPGPRYKFPPAPPPPPGIFRARRRVQWREIDSQMHLNNAMVVEYASDCGGPLLEAHGWTYRRMIDEGFGIVIRRYHVEYKQSAQLDDELEIASWLSEVRRATAIRHYTLRRVSDGSLLAQLHAFAVGIDLSAGQPIRIPPRFIANFAANISAPQ